MPLFGYLLGLVTPAMLIVCINKSSSNFLLSLYLITAGKTRHGNGSVSCKYPDIPENEGNTTDTIPVQFSVCRSFRRTKKGRAGTVCQRSARTGTRRNFVIVFSFFALKIAARLWQTKTLSHHPQAERYEKVCNSLVLLGFYLGKFSADLLLRGSRMWYHESTNRRKRFISRKNVFLIVGIVPAEAVGRKPM